MNDMDDNNYSIFINGKIEYVGDPLSEIVKKEIERQALKYVKSGMKHEKLVYDFIARKIQVNPGFPQHEGILSLIKKMIKQREQEVERQIQEIQELFYEKIVPLNLNSSEAKNVISEYYIKWKEITEGIPQPITIKAEDKHLETLRHLVNTYFNDLRSEEQRLEYLEYKKNNK